MSWSNVELNFLKNIIENGSVDNLEELSNNLSKSQRDVLSKIDELQEKEITKKPFLVQVSSPKDGVTIMHPDFADYKTNSKNQKKQKTNNCVEKIYKDGKTKN